MHIFKRSAFVVCSLICVFLLPVLIMTAAANGSPANVHKTGAINATVSAFSGGESTATLTLTAADSQGNAVTMGNVEWTITRIVSNTNQAVTTAFQYSLAGLSLGDAAWLLPAYALDKKPSASTVPAVVPVTKDISQSVTLSDIVGERVVEVSATITIDSSPQAFTGTVSFGNGPLSAFRLPASAGGTVGYADWADKHKIDEATSLPAANMCGANLDWATFRTWTAGDYSSQTNLPTRAELQAVADESGNGARLAAGWHSIYYWSGELSELQPGGLTAYSVYIESGHDNKFGSDTLITGRAVVCRRQ